MTKKVTKKTTKKSRGKPPIVKSPAEMQTLVDDYFKNPPTKRMIVGDVLLDVPVITVCGLALHLGFADRQSLYDYRKRPEYSCTIKKALLRVQNDYEIDVKTKGNVTGAIFVLKSMGFDKNMDDTQNSDEKAGVLMVPDMISIDAWEKAGQEAMERIKEAHNDMVNG